MYAPEAAKIRHEARKPEGWTGKGYYETTQTYWSQGTPYPDFIEHPVTISVARCPLSGEYTFKATEGDHTIETVKAHDFGKIASVVEDWWIE